MTIVKKLKKKSISGTSIKKKSSPVRERKKISRKPHIPSKNLSEYTILIHGREGIGKTTLISQFPSIYFAMFESNSSLSLKMDHIQIWEDFLDYQADFLEGNHDFKGFSMDNPKNAYDLNMDYTCTKYSFDHPGQMNDHGDSWNKLKKEFAGPIRKLMNSPFGFIVSCHSEEKKITRMDGSVYDMIAPDLPKQAYALLCKEIQNIFYYFYEGKKRWLQIIGDEYVVAKNKMEDHFIAQDGKPVFKIPMGNSKQEAFKNLMKAFNNEQKESYYPVVTEFKKKKKVNKK